MSQYIVMEKERVPSLNSMLDVHQCKNWRTLLYCVSELGTGGWRRGATLTFLAAETRPGTQTELSGDSGEQPSSAQTQAATPPSPHPAHTNTGDIINLYF